MDTIKSIEKLASMARQDSTPEYDVSKTVMLQIEGLQLGQNGYLPVEFFAGISAIAASMVAFFSIQAWRYMLDPLIQLFVPFQEIPLW